MCARACVCVGGGMPFPYSAIVLLHHALAALAHTAYTADAPACMPCL